MRFNARRFQCAGRGPGMGRIAATIARCSIPERVATAVGKLTARLLIQLLEVGVIMTCKKQIQHNSRLAAGLAATVGVASALRKQMAV